MKKRLSLLLAILAVLVSTAMADNKISADPLTIAKSGTADLSINLTNTDAIAAVQFKVTLPEGVSIVESTQGISYDGDGGEPYKPTNGVKVTLTDRTSNMMVVGNKTGDNTYIFVLISLSGHTINTGEGAIMKISFQTAAEAALGNYTVKIDDIHLSSTNGVDLTSSAVNTDMDILKKGDVNGDDDVNITDFVCIINHMYKQPNASFHENIADVNLDGAINISDAVSVINIMYGGNNSQTRGINEETEWADPD